MRRSALPLALSCAMLMGAAEPEETRGVPAPNFLRAAAESGILLGIGIVWYFIDYQVSHETNETPFSFETYRKKLTTTDLLRFDTSSFFHNGFGHAYAAGLYYNAWRSNGFSEWQAYLANLGIALFWEFLVEYREVASINDLIVTSFSGLSLGETAHQLTFALRNDSHDAALAAIADPWQLINAALDRRKADPRLVDGTRWQLSLTAGTGASYFTTDATWQPYAEVYLRSRLFRGPEPDREGARFLFGSPLTDLKLLGALSENGLVRFELITKNVLAGWLLQTKDGESYVMGGLATTFSHARRPFPGLGNYSAIIDFLGPTIELRRTIGDLALWLTADGSPSFAIIRSLAIDSFALQHDISHTKTTLREHGYYYGYGYTIAAEAGVSYGELRLHGWARLDDVRSIQGRDRFQEVVKDDFELRDKRAQLSANVSYGFAGDVLALGAAYEYYRATGEITEPVHASESRVLLRFTFTPPGRLHAP